MSRIFAYMDYRAFLRDELERKRRRNGSFSIRAAAARMGIGSGTLSRILSGSRNIGPSLLPAITAYLGLKARESRYFRLLVTFSRTSQPGKKRRYYEQILEMRAAFRETIPPEHYRIFEHWPCLALHQLLRIVDNCSDPARLGAMLQPSVSAAKMRTAVALLLNNKLIRANDRGGYTPTEKSLTTGETWRGAAIHGFQRTTAAMAGKALDAFPKDQRDFSTLTVALSRERFEAAREIIRCARREILALDEKESNPERVYQLNFQLYPLSRPPEGERSVS
ncbi:MAG: TIGR02147 family protein [Chitinivibrionales bacterium]|nr:TIGR02147 family protein [Chitinivibrionales bacterium]